MTGTSLCKEQAQNPLQGTVSPGRGGVGHAEKGCSLSLRLESEGNMGHRAGCRCIFRLLMQHGAAG